MFTLARKTISFGPPPQQKKHDPNPKTTRMNAIYLGVVPITSILQVLQDINLTTICLPPSGHLNLSFFVGLGETVYHFGVTI